jgi:transketolase
MNCLHERIIEISKKYKLSHIGSNLTSANIIDEIYYLKKDDEPFVLSMGHAALALYVVGEAFYGINAEESYLTQGNHPKRSKSLKIDCSSGSLGLGLPLSVGMALADRSKNVYCLISDGECFEGSVWESLNIIRKYKITNLKLYLNYNGWSAYDKVEPWMIDNIKMLMPSIKVVETSVEDYGLSGLSAHYVTL